MKKQRVIGLYFSARDKDTLERIRRYAAQRGISFGRAVWELVEKGLKRKGGA